MDDIASQTQQQTVLFGRFQHNVDKAGRMSVPAKWWRSRAQSDQKFMVLLWPLNNPKCLKVLPPEMYGKVIQSLPCGPLTNEEDEKLMRSVGSLSDIQEVDDSGRLAVRLDLLEKIGVKSEALLVGCIRYFEIWNEQNFQAALAETLQVAADNAKQKGI